MSMPHICQCRICQRTMSPFSGHPVSVTFEEVDVVNPLMEVLAKAVDVIDTGRELLNVTNDLENDTVGEWRELMDAVLALRRATECFDRSERSLGLMREFRRDDGTRYRAQEMRITREFMSYAHFNAVMRHHLKHYEAIILRYAD